MKKSDIINAIEDIEKQYKSYKDGGRSFIDYLAKKIFNTIDEEKNEVINFFLDEIKTNENGFCDIALLTITEIGSLDIAPSIECIYNEVKQLKDDRWKHSIIETLMKLRYSKPKQLYAEYMTMYLDKEPDDSFYMLVLYCNVDSEKGLSLLSDFYVKHLFKNKEMHHFLEIRIDFLVNYFIESPKDYFPDLVKQTSAKEKKIGLYLKGLIINYLNSDMVKDYPNELIKDRIEKLYKLNV